MEFDTKNVLTYKGSKSSTKSSMHATVNALKTKSTSNTKHSSNLNRPTIRSKSAARKDTIRPEKLHSKDEVSNSCSNITASTYCNGNGMSQSSGIAIDFESSTQAEQKLNYDRDSVYSGVSSDRFSHRSRDVMSETGNHSLRRESTSTYERDMDIIDLLERERSMNLIEIVENERKPERLRKKSSSTVNRTNSGGRKLPDIAKITAPHSPKRQISEQSVNFPNFVFTHQYNEFAEARNNRNRDSIDTIASQHNAQSSFVKRDSAVYEEIASSDVNRRSRSRTRSMDSRKSSTKSSRDSRLLSSTNYNDKKYSGEL